MLAQAKQREYIGEPVSQLEHALQCAKIALDAVESNEFIAAALFHDIGHLCASEEALKMGSFGIDQHHRIGAQFLAELGFPLQTTQLIEGHVEAKRYLVAKNPRYLKELSPASLETLKMQGGPMTLDELAAFEKNPFFKQMLKLRTYDDRAKELNWSVPPLSFYREMMDLLLVSREAPLIARTTSV
jgi:putative nucleotidyltransferase with HDIG domain